MKPVPPEDLWEQVDALIAPIAGRPENVFSAAEYGEHKGITSELARHHLNAAVHKGTFEKVKVGGKAWYRVKAKK